MNVIGLISGTSVDGIDAALVSLSGSTTDLTIDLIAAETYPYPEELRSRILSVCGGSSLSMAEFAALDDAIAHQFAQAALTLQAKHSPIDLVGSHGQTVYHRPPQSPTFDSQLPLPTSLGYSLQLGRGSLIAHLTGIPTVSNFRAADIAAGGQGAPLVSPIDVCLFRHTHEHRCVQNIGGIGNVTYLPALGSSLPIMGWDTGPGNALLDLAVFRFSNGQQTFDQNGTWAAQGTPHLELVQHWLEQDFFHQPPPKSTGRELFGEAYLDRCWQDAQSYSLSNTDILATLTELTAASIAHSYRTFLPQLPDQVLICGGGSRNPYLKQRIQANLAPAAVYTTDEIGLNADFKEAISFAVLAYWRYLQIPGNLPEVTGARRSMLLGEIHLVV
jgi:anhydro-N-acetylmuramic acid kinase